MAKEVQARVALFGRVDNSFRQLGAALEQLGNFVNQFSTPLLQFGKESVEEYVKYEDAMLDAQAALATQATSTRELSQWMDTLDTKAMEWASTSRFTTDDVANSISQAAHAGWDLNKILNGIPAAMNIARAGQMELGQGLEYLIDVSNAAGLSFDDLGTLTDVWAFAANSSSTDIEEMGQALQRLGGTMQFFKGDMTQAAVMLAALADNGVKGTDAGTALRNTMIRLIAPTQKAEEAMEALGLTTEEVEELYGEDSKGLKAALKDLEDAGFTAYDSSGNLKKFTDIWKDLGDTLDGLSEEKQNKILSAIFPTRTLASAKTLIAAAQNDWNGLLESLLNDSENYASKTGEIMESGLGGKLRMLESAYQTLQTKTGKSLSEDVGNLAVAATNLVNGINGLDPAVFDSFVSGLEVIAVAGPTLLVAGGAIKGIGTVMAMMPWAKWALAGIAIAAVARGLHELNEEMYKDKFGSMELDGETISKYISGLGDSFDQSRVEIEKYNTAVETALTDYQNATTTLSETLLTKLLTNSKITPEEEKQLLALGGTIYDTVKKGIDAKYSSVETSVANVAGQGGWENGGLWYDIMESLNYGYEDALNKAEELSKQLHDKLTSAFKNGLTKEDYDGILKTMSDYNELIADKMDANDQARLNRRLRQAQTLSLEELEKWSQEAQSEREEREGEAWDEYEAADASLRAALKKMVKDKVITQEEADKRIQGLWDGGTPDDPTDGFQGRVNGVGTRYDKYMTGLWDAAISGSELAGAFGNLKEFADNFMETGVITEQARNKYTSSVDEGQQADLRRYMDSYVDAMGGYEKIAERAAYYQAQGDTEMAGVMNSLLAMYMLASAPPSGIAASDKGVGIQTNQQVSGTDYTTESARKQLDSLYASDDMAQLVMGYIADVFSGDENAFSAAEAVKNLMSGNVTDTGFQSGLRSIVDSLNEVYDLSAVKVPQGLEGIQDLAAAYMLMFGNLNPDDYLKQPTIEPEVEAPEPIEVDPVTVPVTPVVEGDPEGLESITEGETKPVDVDYDDPGFEPEEVEKPITVVYNDPGFDPGSATMTVTVQYNDPGYTPKGGGTGGGMGGGVATGGTLGMGGGRSVPNMYTYAEGGRADEASIFGEAGPEWAIPEEHTDNTADLLNQAIQASGFTHDELLSRKSSNSNTTSKGTQTIVYSPTIYAQDARDVETKLIEDKRRLDDWFKEHMLREEVEVYT